MKLIVGVLIGILGYGSVFAGKNEEIKLDPLSVGGSIEWGQIFGADKDLLPNGDIPKVTSQQYTNMWMFQSAKIGDRITLNFGLAGSLFYPYPFIKGEGWGAFRTGGLGISAINGTYLLGDVADPWMKIKVGHQGLKYNKYSKTFGEYLFRSEAYPTTIRTGGWGSVGNSSATILGALFESTHFDGLLTNQFVINMATEFYPLYDISLTNMTTLNFGDVFTIGGGVSWNRAISITDRSLENDRETSWLVWTQDLENKLNTFRQNDTSSYFTSNPIAAGDTLRVGTTYWTGTSSRPDSVENGEVVIPGVSQNQFINGLLDTSSALNKSVQPGGAVERIDYRAFYFMAKASFDFKPLFDIGTDVMGAEDGVLYFEAALLGHKNYPIFYEKYEERLPIMVGFNVPTFGLLDYLNLEMEIFKSPYVNSNEVAQDQERPEPGIATGSVIPRIADPDNFDKLYNVTEDDFKWAVNVQKTVGVLQFNAKVANDHYRPITSSFRPNSTELTIPSDSWSYFLKVSVNL